MQSLPSSLCSSCRLQISSKLPIRSFSTSICRRSIPPEAPNYVDVPSSYQAELIQPRRQKGVLPVPRELFPTNRPDKPSGKYLQNVTPDKLAKNMIPESKLTDQKRYKLRMSEMRKEHLRQGLTALHYRKQRMTRQLAKRSQEKIEERNRLISQAPRIDEQLTNVSTPETMLNTRSHQSHNIPGSLQHKLENVRKEAIKKQELRQEALHNLYMNARSFITTEEQLLKTIDEKFVEGRSNPEWRTSGMEAENIWNKGAPLTVSEMLADNTIKPRRDFTMAGLGDTTKKHEKDQQRLQRIAEELTGGKM